MKLKKLELKKHRRFLLNQIEEEVNEKRVRIYRGVGQLETIFKQVPYGIRKSDGSIFSGPKSLEIKEVVEEMATQPTYENLTKYIKLASENGGDSKKLNEKLLEIENDVLRPGVNYGFTESLQFETFKHSGGLMMESGISPYLSASFDLKEALGFTKKGGVVMVIDIPISKLNFYGKDTDGELFINGTLDSKYIRALIPKAEDIDDENEQEVLEKINQSVENIPGNVFLKNELPKVVSDDSSQREELIKKNDEISLKQIQNKRAKDLMQLYGYRIPEIENLIAESQEDVDPYSKTMRAIFDAYKSRLEKIGLNLDSYDYQSGTFLNPKSEGYIRDRVSEKMLKKLGDIVNREQDNYDLMEERREQRRKMQGKV